MVQPVAGAGLDAAATAHAAAEVVDQNATEVEASRAEAGTSRETAADDHAAVSAEREAAEAAGGRAATSAVQAAATACRFATLPAPQAIPAPTVMTAIQGSSQSRATGEGLLPEPSAVARAAVVPGYGSAETVANNPIERVAAREAGGLPPSASKTRGLVSTRQTAPGTEVDVLIYGRPLGGLMAAERAARRGLSWPSSSPRLGPAA